MKAGASSRVREADGIVVSLLWSRAGNRVKVVVADTRTQRQFEFAVAPARALDAFRHPFVYAGSEVEIARAAADAGGRRLSDLSSAPANHGAPCADPETGFRGERRPIPASHEICTTPARRKAAARHIQVTHTDSKEK